MKSIYLLRNLLQKYGVKHWQYLVLALSFSFFSAITWFSLTVRTGMELGFLTVLIGGIQGILAYLFMSEKGEPKKVFFALFFSISAFLLGKYLYFEHYYDWYLTAYIDKSEFDFDLILFYVRNINIGSLQLFISEAANVFSLYDILWVILIIISSLQFVFYNFEKDKPNLINSHRKKFRKRRFE